MKMRVDLLRWPVAALAGLLFAMPAASAADYPNKPVRWVVGYPPGGDHRHSGPPDRQCCPRSSASSS